MRPAARRHRARRAAPRRAPVDEHDLHSAAGRLRRARRRSPAGSRRRLPVGSRSPRPLLEPSANPELLLQPRTGQSRTPDSIFLALYPMLTNAHTGIEPLRLGAFEPALDDFHLEQLGTLRLRPQRVSVRRRHAWRWFGCGPGSRSARARCCCRAHRAIGSTRKAAPGSGRAGSSRHRSAECSVRAGGDSTSEARRADRADRGCGSCSRTSGSRRLHRASSSAREAG